MTVVRLYAGLREAAGQRDFEVDLPAGAVIGELLRRLIALRPKLAGKVLDENGSVPRYVAVFVNGRDIRHLNGLETPVQPQDEIAIFPPVAGGGLSTDSGTDKRMGERHPLWRGTPRAAGWGFLRPSGSSVSAGRRLS
jgi:molybdopterin synthase sulfur carrier subunit